MTRLTDRHGTALAVGQRVRIQVCVGRYGQTAIRQGTVAEIHGSNLGVMLKTEAAFREDRGRFGVHYRPAGSLVYVSVPHGGYSKFDDYEHGHEEWVEILA